ncbi:DUF7683 domain-containing protein [Niallia circulans]|uniref:DUF7683 domain-containing protein n=1 Tax=Niallia circulans TaxID=1397 RepID=UPI003008D730
MTNHIKFQWRVTKYNPAFRDENGYFTLTEEWTSPTQIGEIINGKKFTLDENLQVENAYVEAVMKFLEESGVHSLRILNATKQGISEEDLTASLYEDAFDQLVLQEDMRVERKEIRLICKMVLRNFLGSQLYAKDKFFVHFGWDYYMYIGSYVNCPSAIDYATSNGLFVETFQSPYYFSEEETIRQVQWYEIDDPSMIIAGEEQLPAIPLDEYRSLFNLSSEHPVIGTFAINEGQLDFFQKHLQHNMDINKYAYSLWAGY